MVGTTENIGSLGVHGSVAEVADNEGGSVTMETTSEMLDSDTSGRSGIHIFNYALYFGCSYVQLLRANSVYI